MTAIEATRASTAQYVLAEGPVWSAARGGVLWVDVERGQVFEGHLRDGAVVETRRHDFDGRVGAVVPGDDGSLLVATKDRLVVIEEDGSRHDGPFILEGDELRSNDGGCDPAGRFLIGTYHYDERPGEDTLQRLEFDGSLTVLDRDLSTSNGLAWSPDGTLLYSTDTAPGIIWVRDYDVASGAVGPRREHLRIRKGYPDGITIDAHGHLWIAIWSGFEVRSFAPDGTPGDVVRVPVPDVSSVAFVGPSLETLLITTSSRDLDEAGRREYPDAGRLFLADVGVTGQPTTAWRNVISR